VSRVYLADTSAWYRAGSTDAVREKWSKRLGDGSVALASPVRLELLYSARGPADYAVLAGDLAALPELAVDAGATARAEEVQALLASRSQQRGPTPIDLLIAAVAELNDAVLVHYDRHFDAVARVTGQPTEWIAPRGTLD